MTAAGCLVLVFGGGLVDFLEGEEESEDTWGAGAFVTTGTGACGWGTGGFALAFLSISFL